MRKPLIVANWKLNKTQAEARAFCQGLLKNLQGITGVEVVVCPPFTSLAAVRAEIVNQAVRLGAQDVFWKQKGAFTGEVSPAMLVDCGCEYVIIGHSERRGRFGKLEPDFTPELLKIFGETDSSVNIKSKAALSAGLKPIVCVGETAGERTEGRTEEIIKTQIALALEEIAGERFPAIAIAYEPVWAIGTGNPCTPEEATRIAELIQGELERLCESGEHHQVRILYGGSVDAKNAVSFMSSPSIDGALVGGASLDAGSFAAIIKAAQTEKAAARGK